MKPTRRSHSRRSRRLGKTGNRPATLLGIAQFSALSLMLGAGATSEAPAIPPSADPSPETSASLAQTDWKSAKATSTRVGSETLASRRWPKTD